MHSTDTQWWLTQSADYVLGLLSDPDRLVFERIMQVEPGIQNLVVEWREILQPMSSALTPIEPPEHILPSLITNLPVLPDRTASGDAEAHEHNAITGADGSLSQSGASRRKQADDRAAVLADGTAFMRMLDKKQSITDGWRSYAGLATVACIVLGSLGWLGYNQYLSKAGEHQFDAISIIENPSAQPLWIVDASNDAKTLRVTAIAPPELEQGKAFELWIEKPNDGGVVSMGLLPATTNASMQFIARQFDPEATSFSVSLESSDGSAESVPTGEVLYRGTIQALSF